MRVTMAVHSFVLTLIIANSFGFQCGPNEKCVCDSKIQMNCSETNIPLMDICEFIKNSTEISVSTLYVERNNYKNVLEYDLNGCVTLSKLYLRGNRLSFIDKNSLSRLELLDISWNEIPIYDQNFEKNISFPVTLRALMLNGNPISSGSGQESYPNLSSLTHLSDLYMDGLRGKVFPEMYRLSTNLTTLSLSGINGYCNMTGITNSTFRNLPNLRILNISSCDIQYIEAGAFESLSYLEVLDLSYNLRLGLRMLRNVSYGLQFTNIKYLNYSKVHTTFGMGTQLKKQDVCYLWNTSLVDLGVSSNRLQLIETNAALLMPETLKVLRIEDNKFTFGLYLLQPGCMTNLEVMYASYQHTAHSPIFFNKEPKEKDSDESIVTGPDCPYMQDEFLRNISKPNKNCYFFENDHINSLRNWYVLPSKLRKVELSRSNMQYNLKSFMIFPYNNSVEYLDVSGNILYSWIGPIGPFPRLKHLNLSRNYCSFIGFHFFENMNNVEDLQLQENFLGLVLSNMEYGPKVFEKLTNVKVLNLSSNIISYLPPNVFAHMLKLETLDLSVNNIDSWIINVKPLNNLLHLNLKFNSFHVLPRYLTNKLVSNENRRRVQFTVDLSNNTFITYCDEKEYLKWMVEHRQNMINFDKYTFHKTTGATVPSIQFEEIVSELDKACRSYTLIIVLATIGLSVFLAVVICGFIYKKRWQLRYLMRMSKFRYFGYKKLQSNLDRNVNFRYNAFISYANENVRFILDKIIPNLESRELKLCVHDRDFLPGNNIADNILDAIRNSEKTVVILSKNYLKSKWCVYEFNMARMESIYSRDGTNCLILVMLEDVPTREMSTEMLEWIRLNTYIDYTTDAEGEELFWQNLTEALTE